MAASWAEEVFDEFGVAFELGNPPKELRFPPGQTKIDIFLNQGYDQRFGGASYYAGLVLHAPGHKNLEPYGGQRAAISRATLRHELVHVLEMLLKGGEGPGLPPWFREGIAATWQPRSVRHPKIQTLEELESTLKEAGLSEQELDPIGQVSDEHYYALIQRIPRLNRIYYRLFDLAVRYLVSTRGLGTSYVDAKAFYLDLRAGLSFPAAFAKRFGLTPEQYRTSFFERMRTHLRGGASAGRGGSATPDATPSSPTGSGTPSRRGGLESGVCHGLLVDLQHEAMGRPTRTAAAAALQGSAASPR